MSVLDYLTQPTKIDSNKLYDKILNINQKVVKPRKSISPVALDSTSPMVSNSNVPVEYKNYADLCKAALNKYKRCTIPDVYKFARIHKFRPEVSRPNMNRQLRETMSRVGTSVGEGRPVLDNKSRKSTMWVLSVQPVTEPPKKVESVEYEIPDKIILSEVIKMVKDEIGLLGDEPTNRVKCGVLSLQLKWYLIGLMGDVPPEWNKYKRKVKESYDKSNSSK
jgi:hypothetical protein